MLQGMNVKPSSASPAVFTDGACDGLLRQGRAVLAALGEKRLAREFCRRALEAPDREALVAALVDCIVRRRPR